MSIVNDIMEKIEAELVAELITNLAANDPTRAGAVKIGNYQGDPSPEEGRITVSIHENDPDRIVHAGVTGMNRDLSDEPDEIEIGGAVTMTRHFTIKLRCLFVKTREDEQTARRIALTVRERIERVLKKMSFAGVISGTEYVARGIVSPDLRIESMQAGGPPDSFDYVAKYHFSVLTTQTGVYA